MPENTDNTQLRVLIVEDEIAIAEGLMDLCEFKGFQAEHVQDGLAGVERALSGEFHLVILDLMLPKLDGFSVCNRIREKDRELPIIILSAKTSEHDIIEGLSLGADDYISKPFSVETLFARIQAVLRRSRKTVDPTEILQIGKLKVRFRDFSGVRGTEEIQFTRKEIDILQHLWNARDRVVPRHELLHEVWGYENAESVDTRTVDIHMTKLRKKIEDDPAHPRLLLTLRGEGYQLRTVPSA